MGRSPVVSLLSLGFFSFLACSTTSQTSVTAPDASKCQVTVGGTTTSFGATGGSGSISVSAARECSWTATSGASWISINGSASGQGDGIVGYSVAANQVPAPRSGALNIASATVQLSQAGAPCAFTLSRARDSVVAAGGPLSVGVSTLAGCAWNATALDPWLIVAAGQSGNASGTVTLSVAANGGDARVGHASIAGQTFTVSQAAAGAPPTNPLPTDPPPTNPPPPTKVHLDGTVRLLVGSCPNLQFVVNDTLVVTDESTDYPKKPSCEDMRSGVHVVVDGLRDGAVVRAQTIEIK